MKNNVLITSAMGSWLWSQGPANSLLEWFSDKCLWIGKPLQLVEVVQLLISLELEDEPKKATVLEIYTELIARRPD